MNADGAGRVEGDAVGACGVRATDGAGAGGAEGFGARVVLLLRFDG